MSDQQIELFIQNLSPHELTYLIDSIVYSNRLYEVLDHIEKCRETGAYCREDSTPVLELFGRS